MGSAHPSGLLANQRLAEEALPGLTPGPQWCGQQRVGVAPPQEGFRNPRSRTCPGAPGCFSEEVPSGQAKPSCTPAACCLRDLGHLLSPRWTSLVPGGSGGTRPRGLHGSWGSHGFLESQGDWRAGSHILSGAQPASHKPRPEELGEGVRIFSMEGPHGTFLGRGWC